MPSVIETSPLSRSTCSQRNPAISLRRRPMVAASLTARAVSGSSWRISRWTWTVSIDGACGGSVRAVGHSASLAGLEETNPLFKPHE